jgi:hypothetical protein
MRMDGGQQRRTDLVGFEQMAEFADRGFVRGGLAPEIDADEGAHGGAVVEGFLGRRIG